MASIKQLDERRYKITVSNGYRPNGKKISKAKTIQVPSGVPKRGIGQYVAHAAEELERSFKTGYAEDGEMTFEEFASRWLNRQTKYAPSTIAAYRRMLEVVYPMIGGIRLNKLRPMALENMLSALRKRKHHGKRINESTAQRYLSVVSAVLSDAKRNEIIEKNPARMLDLSTPQRTVQRIPTRSEVEKLLDALAKEPRHYRLFYLLSMYTGCGSGATPAVRRACSVLCVKQQA
jgi:integrase